MKITAGAGAWPAFRSPMVWLVVVMVVVAHMCLLIVLGADTSIGLAQRSSVGQSVSPILVRPSSRASASAAVLPVQATVVPAASGTTTNQLASIAREDGPVTSGQAMALATMVSLPSPAHYYAAEEVDLLPSLPDALSFGTLDVAAWTLTLRLWVSADGSLDHVEVLAATPDGAWPMPVLNALAATKLEPGQLAGAAVPVQFDVQLGPDTLW